MKQVNQNNLARDVTIVEAGRFTINNGQTKEVIHITFDVLIDDYGTNDMVRLEVIRNKNGKIRITAV